MNNLPDTETTGSRTIDLLSRKPKVLVIKPPGHLGSRMAITHTRPFYCSSGICLGPPR